MEESEQFVGKIIDVGNSKGVMIPIRNIQYSGLKTGDWVKVWYKKKVDEVKKEGDEVKEKEKVE